LVLNEKFVIEEYNFTQTISGTRTNPWTDATEAKERAYLAMYMTKGDLMFDVGCKDTGSYPCFESRSVAAVKDVLLNVKVLRYYVSSKLKSTITFFPCGFDPDFASTLWPNLKTTYARASRLPGIQCASAGGKGRPSIAFYESVFVDMAVPPSSTAQESLPVAAADSILAAMDRAPRKAPLPFKAVFQTRALPSHQSAREGFTSLNQSRMKPEIRPMAPSPESGLGVQAMTTMRADAGAVAVRVIRFIASVRHCRPASSSARRAETGPSSMDDAPVPSWPKEATALATCPGVKSAGLSSRSCPSAASLEATIALATSLGILPVAPHTSAQ